MKKMTVEELIGFVDKQFNQQMPMLSLWQSMAENFYPERSDFLMTRNNGDEFADNLLSSYPVITRRDLGNSLSSMLRDGNWFEVDVEGETDHEGKGWLQWASGRQRKFMYHKEANFVGASKMADHDYVTFGQPVMSIEPNRKYNGLLYRTWHLRDCAWWEDETGQVCGVVRKWSPYLRQLVNTFGMEALHKDMVKDILQNQMKDQRIYHVHMPSEFYGDDEKGQHERFKYVSVYVDPKNKHVIEEVYTNNKHYVVPRFHKIAGSAYAYSPAAVAALPDARMLQAMTHTMMEAGERYARPPLLARAKTVSSAVDLGPDGITWIDTDEEKFALNNALQTLNQDRGAFPIAFELRADIHEALKSAFYTSNLALPDINRDMTAYEVQERMKQYRRENLPLFSPVEAEYSAAVCEQSFDLGMQMGMFGSPHDIPESLRQRDVQFKFKSPLTESEEEKKAQRYSQVSEMLAASVDLDPSTRHNVNFDEALRDAIEGIGAPAKWLNNPEQVQFLRQQDQELAMAQAQDEQQTAA